MDDFSCYEHQRDIIQPPISAKYVPLITSIPDCELTTQVALVDGPGVFRTRLPKDIVSTDVIILLGYSGPFLFGTYSGTR